MPRPRKDEGWMLAGFQDRLYTFELDPETWCWNWAKRVDKDGYGQISINHKTYRVSRVIAAIFFGVELSGKHVVRHMCNNRRCINPAHLAIGTQLDNVNDSRQVGTWRGWGNKPQFTLAEK